MNEAMRDWVTNVEITNCLIGSVAGPRPLRAMVREDEGGRTVEGRSISTGPEHPGVGTDHEWVHDAGGPGARAEVSSAASALMGRAAKVAGLPVRVGSAVGTGTRAAEVTAYADGVIAGSAFVRALPEASNAMMKVTAVEELDREPARGVRGETAREGSL